MANPPIAPLGTAALTVISFFLLCAYVAVFLRMYAIHLVERPYRVHDYLIFLGLALASGHIAIEYLAIVVGGMGNHVRNVPISVVSTLLKFFVADNFSWLFTTSTVKLSVLYLYLDIFKVQKTFRLVVYGFIGFVAAFFIGFLVSLVLLCQPFSHYWNTSGPGFCGSLSDSQIATASINIAVDLSIMLLPIAPIWRLQMKRSKKIKVSCVFGVGGIICLINIARLVCVLTLDQADFSYSLAASAILTALEVELGITCACLPTINPIFRQHEDLRDRLGSWELRSAWKTRSTVQASSSRHMFGSMRRTNSSVETGSNIVVTQNFGVHSDSDASLTT